MYLCSHRSTSLSKHCIVCFFNVCHLMVWMVSLINLVLITNNVEHIFTVIGFLCFLFLKTTSSCLLPFLPFFVVFLSLKSFWLVEILHIFWILILFGYKYYQKKFSQFIACLLNLLIMFFWEKGVFHFRVVIFIFIYL